METESLRRVVKAQGCACVLGLPGGGSLGDQTGVSSSASGLGLLPAQLPTPAMWGGNGEGERLKESGPQSECVCVSHVCLAKWWGVQVPVCRWEVLGKVCSWQVSDPQVQEVGSQAGISAPNRMLSGICHLGGREDKGQGASELPAAPQLVGAGQPKPVLPPRTPGNS